MYLTLETLAGGPQICYYHYDALGSVTDLSNSSGSHIEHYYYDPFGNTRIYDPATGLKRTDSIIGNPYKFTARRWDSESSLYYYRARMYDPALGKFLQADPIGYTAGDMNLYRYCGNNPVNLLDPLGLEGDKDKPWWEELLDWLIPPAEAYRDPDEMLEEMDRRAREGEPQRAGDIAFKKEEIQEAVDKVKLLKKILKKVLDLWKKWVLQ